MKQLFHLLNNFKEIKRMKVRLFAIVIVFSIISWTISRKQDNKDSPASDCFIVDTIAKDLVVPWDIVFLPDKTMLFTERTGHVRIYRNNQLLARPALSVTDIEARGKMGLLSLCLHPDFATNKYLYLAYNYRRQDKSLLRVVRYDFRQDSLLQPFTIVESIPAAPNHTGCRLAFGPDKKLYITTGDADVPRLSQDLKSLNGKILRLSGDGSIPSDNPFVNNDTARHEIWSYGHRNSQGISFQPGSGFLFSSEHGPTGGDEINLVAKGNNYGWPVMHHRNNQDGMMSPLMEFTPSIGPAEAIFYSGKAFPSMKGNLLVSCMRGESVLNIKMNKSKLQSYGVLMKNKYGRIRALAEDANGYIYFSTSQVDPPESRLEPGEREFDMILRMKPCISGKENPASQLIGKAELTEAINTTVLTVLKKASSTKDATGIIYSQLCAGCHGADLKGVGNIPSLVDAEWLHGGTKAGIRKSVSKGITDKGMPAWEGVLTDRQIDSMATFILSAGK